MYAQPWKSLSNESKKNRVAAHASKKRMKPVVIQRSQRRMQVTEVRTWQNFPVVH